MSDTATGTHLVVVGGGITGLAAAWEASSRPGSKVTVLEAGDRFGGKVRTSDLDVPGGPLRVDEGADMFLTRVPGALELCRELGLEDRLTVPQVARAKVWVDGRLRWFPARSVLGVPLDEDDLASTGLLDADAMRRVRAEQDRDDPPLTGDVAIGPWLAERFGRDLVDRIVGPLVGGINAGDVDRLSLRAVTPQLAAAAEEGGSLTEALHRRVAAAQGGPAFNALLGGTQELTDSLVDALRVRGADLRSRTAVLGLEPSPTGGVQVRTPEGVVGADAVVVTTPAPVTASLLAPHSPTAAGELRSIEHTSVALVTLAVRRADIDLDLDASGLLVPREAGLLCTAVSWGSRKWRHWDDGSHLVLRASAGHSRDQRIASMDDDELVAGLLSDLRTTMGLEATPVAVRVSRYPDGFPQYSVGHLERCDRIEQALARDLPRVRVAGAFMRGLGLPACISQGRAAAAALL